MLIRDAEDVDFEAIAAITNHYIQNTAIHFATEPVTGDAVRDAWQRSRGTYPFMVLQSDGSQPPRRATHPREAMPLPEGVIGFARAHRWRERAAYEKTAEVGVYMRPELCGRGMGRELYAGLIQVCRDRGFHSLIGGISLPNAPSVKLHEALGFVHVGTVKDAGWKFERWHDVGFWQLMLG